MNVKEELSPNEAIDAHRRRVGEMELIPDGIPLLQLAEMVVRGKVRLSPQQSRMLIEMLPYVAPKLTAVAISKLTGEEFAKALDRAIEMSRAGPPARLIEGKVIEEGEG